MRHVSAMGLRSILALWSVGLWACQSSPSQLAGDARPRPDAWPGVVGCESGLAFDDVTNLSPDLATNPYGGEAGWDHADKYGPGIGLADLDGDGNLDLVQVRSERNTEALRHPVVYRGMGDGSFQQAAMPPWNANDNGTFALLFDYDGDEDLDILLGVAGGDPQLYRNDSEFIFVEVTAQAGLSGTASHAYAAAAGDVNADGFIDLYLGQWRADLPDHGPGMAPNKLLLGSANGFVSAPDPLSCEGRSTLGLAMADLDADGDLDIYVANDFFPDCLYENRGSQGFRDVAEEAGVATAAMHAMGVAIGDLNGDERLDILVTDTEQTDSSRGNAAFVATGTAMNFKSSAPELGLDGISTLQADWLVSWGVGIVDFDLDGYPDIHMATHIEREEIFLHNQAWNFQPAWNAIYGVQPSDARGTAYGDIDGDGDQDIVQGRRGQSIQVLRNTAAPSQFLRVEISPINQAIGATVRVESQGRSHLQVIQAGQGYMSSGPPSVTFGLCGATTADLVEIQWPGNNRQAVTDVPAGIYRLQR